MAQSYQAKVLPFFMSLGMKIEKANKAYSYMLQLVALSALKLISVRLRPKRPTGQPMARLLEETFLKSQLCDWEPREDFRNARQAEAGTASKSADAATETNQTGGEQVVCGGPQKLMSSTSLSNYW